MEGNGMDKMISADSKIYYSPSREGFFFGEDRSKHENSQRGWPEDALEITRGEWEDLFDKQSRGHQIVSGPNGKPMAVPNKPLQKDIDARNKNVLISQADSVIQPMLGYAVSGMLSEEEKEVFKEWNEYRKELENIDVSQPPVKWPEKPE